MHGELFALRQLPTPRRVVHLATITAADRTIDGDTERTVVVEPKNRSGHNCSISGFAGVDPDTAAGPLSAARTKEPVVVSGVLKNGKSTFFGITYPANTSGGSDVRVTNLRVTPPDDNTTVTPPRPGAATLGVSSAPGSPVKIGPIGSAGQANRPHRWTTGSSARPRRARPWWPSACR
ncbi:DUF4232 domain-containing protein [Kitasatospora brasiliensis]|uniref:DUF4232 domain-containing protein n=1 Tax=Kitasatospora brasiliensis TaxID=3058040 RepID=UPI00292D5926|nr:DUF4232 domain-containing protein [Kitasatospora sp. K002]